MKRRVRKKTGQSNRKESLAEFDKRMEREREEEARIHDANVEMYGEEDAYYHTYIKD